MTVELVDRYVQMWNEPDAGLRRATVEALWTDDGAHVLLAPDGRIRADYQLPG